MRSTYAVRRHPRLHRLVELLLLAGAFAALTAARLAAQTISPPIAEYQERARGSFQLTNTTLYPLNVVVELRGFRITEQGEMVDQPLDTSRVHVKLSAMSFRIAPRATYNVFYEAKADSAPAWFNILSAMTGARTDNGINLRIILPHVVYLNQKTALARTDVQVRAFEFDSAGGRVRVQLENAGPRLGRILAVTASGPDGSSKPAAGFPLMPGTRRWTELEWRHPTAPDRVAIRSAKFTLDTALAAVSVRPAPTPAPLPVLAADSGLAPAR
jgi:hypothetical protein